MKKKQVPQMFYAVHAQLLLVPQIAKLFWQEVQTMTGAKLPRLHPASWATDLLLSEVCSDKNRCIFIIGMYSLWMQRNSRRHGEAVKPIRLAVQWAIDTAYDLWLLSTPQQQTVSQRTAAAWRPPPEGWFKCNTDGAFYPQRGRGATGVVLRGNTGIFNAGCARWYPHGLDALTMEALAFRGRDSCKG